MFKSPSGLFFVNCGEMENKKAFEISKTLNHRRDNRIRTCDPQLPKLVR